MTPANLDEKLVHEIERLRLFVAHEALSKNYRLVVRVHTHVQAQLEVIPEKIWPQQKNALACAILAMTPPHTTLDTWLVATTIQGAYGQRSVVLLETEAFSVNDR